MDSKRWGDLGIFERLILIYLGTIVACGAAMTVAFVVTIWSMD